MIPLILKLKKASHKNIATAQDVLVQEMYKIFNNAVIHGGTAIWRCYKGNRFSEDIDVYLGKDKEKINLFFDNLAKRGFSIEKKKVTENSLFSQLKLNRVSVRFEALLKIKSGILKEYEFVDSNFIIVYTLSPEDLINEKIETYLKRLKVRDMYDIFFLLKYVKDANKIKNKLQSLIKEFKKPIDEKELRVLILEGLVPTADDMFNYIKNYKI